MATPSPYALSMSSIPGRTPWSVDYAPADLKSMKISKSLRLDFQTAAEFEINAVTTHGDPVCLTGWIGGAYKETRHAEHDEEIAPDEITGYAVLNNKHHVSFRLWNPLTTPEPSWATVDTSTEDTEIIQ